MIQNTLHALGGIGRYGVISTCLFVGFFVAVLIWSARLKTPHLYAMSALPLDDARAPQPKPEDAPTP